MNLDLWKTYILPTAAIAFLVGALAAWGLACCLGCASSSYPPPEPPIIEVSTCRLDAGDDAPPAEAWTAVDAGPPPGVACVPPCDPHGGRLPL